MSGWGDGDGDIAISIASSSMSNKELFVDYGGRRDAVFPAPIDLDPAADGQQMSLKVTGGSFAPQANCSKPDAGFAGRVQVFYTIQDAIRKASNVAAIDMKVKPNPTDVLKLFSF